MANKRLYILCGIPGSGKTTWLKNNVINPRAAIVSRDTIRFAFLNEKEEYFSKESLVYNEFILTIQNYIISDDINAVFADATHLTRKSRAKLLNSLKETIKYYNVDVFALVFKTPLKICLERNAKRKGRECVPESVIHRMHDQFEMPEIKEGFKDIIDLTEIGEDK